uniref:Uncharacterized protein n=1 Tax=Cuerna arida TaxID=1464854 RepID=A0A1B6H1W8_9HEMI
MFQYIDCYVLNTYCSLLKMLVFVCTTIQKNLDLYTYSLLINTNVKKNELLSEGCYNMPFFHKTERKNWQFCYSNLQHIEHNLSNIIFSSTSNFRRQTAPPSLM